MPLIVNRIHVGTWPESMLAPERSLVLGVKLKPIFNLHTERPRSAFECMMTCFRGRGTALDTCLPCFCRLWGLGAGHHAERPPGTGVTRDALSLQCLASFPVSCTVPACRLSSPLGDCLEKPRGRIVRTFATSNGPK